MHLDQLGLLPFQGVLDRLDRWVGAREQRDDHRELDQPDLGDRRGRASVIKHEPRTPHATHTREEARRDWDV